MGARVPRCAGHGWLPLRLLILHCGLADRAMSQHLQGLSSCGMCRVLEELGYSRSLGSSELLPNMSCWNGPLEISFQNPILNALTLTSYPGLARRVFNSRFCLPGDRCQFLETCLSQLAEVLLSGNSEARMLVSILSARTRPRDQGHNARDEKPLGRR